MIRHTLAFARVGRPSVDANLAAIPLRAVLARCMLVILFVSSIRAELAISKLSGDQHASCEA